MDSEHESTTFPTQVPVGQLNTDALLLPHPSPPFLEINMLTSSIPPAIPWNYLFVSVDSRWEAGFSVPLMGSRRTISTKGEGAGERIPIDWFGGTIRGRDRTPQGRWVRSVHLEPEVLLSVR